ncbi:hypothetical protein NIES267_13420 [Calothrix parasitica NIES-267]|uniref:Signal peptidase I n=1 Tax=Calothrix parasitica NIES-267 TaxID=1973488 RepID=A0A1Z4LKX3_9CYAN|nr:hypothetical protein NIES267_13420 [Calothrix parasitica NIES-267]
MMSLLNTDLSFTYLLAQTSSGSGGAGVLNLIIGLAAYAFSSYCLYVMFQKLNYPKPWFAWVPFLQNWAMFELGDQSPWWIIGFFIPFVNIVAAIYLIIAFINMVKKLGKNPWFILLMIIPLANFAVMYYFALM